MASIAESRKLGPVLVTGASGCVGPRVVQALHSAGYGVRIFSLDAPPSALIPPCVEVGTGDITDEAAVRAVMAGAQAVIHMAALLHQVHPGSSMDSEYRRINVGGTATVVRAALDYPVRRIVFFSTISVYGPWGGRVLSEDSVPQPDTSYARTKLDAEKIVLEARGPGGEPIGTVLRPGAVYGSRVKGNYRKLVQAIAHGRFIRVSKGRNRRALIYDKDAARAAVLVMQHPRAAGGIFNVSDGQQHSINDIVAAICKALGRPPPRLYVPLGPARWMAGILDRTAGLLGRSLSLAASLKKYTEDVAIDSARIQRELGFAAQFSLEDGWREAIEEMRRAGDL
jgi:nucleoside-diphosphate-sugar epimerase